MKIHFLNKILCGLALILQGPICYAIDLSNLSGDWEVVATGHDCVSTGWLQDQFETINGKVIGSKVSIKKDKFTWGKLNCKAPIFSQDKDFVLEFFDGSECKTSPGELPAGCAEPMKKAKNAKVESFGVSCSGSVVLPESYNVLSKDYLLALAESDFICLKRK